MQPDNPQAELYPENQHPHFKTCAARVGGTYHERALQKDAREEVYRVAYDAADNGQGLTIEIPPRTPVDTASFTVASV